MKQYILIQIIVIFNLLYLSCHKYNKKNFIDERFEPLAVYDTQTGKVRFSNSTTSHRMKLFVHITCTQTSNINLLQGGGLCPGTDNNFVIDFLAREINQLDQYRKASSVKYVRACSYSPDGIYFICGLRSKKVGVGWELILFKNSREHARIAMNDEYSKKNSVTAFKWSQDSKTVFIVGVEGGYYFEVQNQKTFRVRGDLENLYLPDYAPLPSRKLLSARPYVKVYDLNSNLLYEDFSVAKNHNYVDADASSDNFIHGGGNTVYLGNLKKPGSTKVYEAYKDSIFLEHISLLSIDNSICYRGRIGLTAGVIGCYNMNSKKETILFIEANSGIDIIEYSVIQM